MEAETVFFIEGIREENPLNHVPAGWTVYNAPRPLWGHTTWRGEFVHGTFYAGVAPAGDPVDQFGDSDKFHKNNQQLDGHVVRWITRAEIVKYAKIMCSEYGIEYDEGDYEMFAGSYIAELKGERGEA